MQILCLVGLLKNLIITYKCVDTLARKAWIQVKIMLFNSPPMDLSMLLFFDNSGLYCSLSC